MYHLCKIMSSFPSGHWMTSVRMSIGKESLHKPGCRFLNLRLLLRVSPLKLTGGTTGSCRQTLYIYIYIFFFRISSAWKWISFTSKDELHMWHIWISTRQKWGAPPLDAGPGDSHSQSGHRNQLDRCVDAQYVHKCWGKPLKRLGILRMTFLW